jgi:DNA-binding NarL/FixJ family response regulator
MGHSRGSPAPLECARPGAAGHPWLRDLKGSHHLPGLSTLTERSWQSPGGAPASVLIAHSEMLVRAGLRTVIDSDPTFHVAAEATNGRHAIELVTRIRPRIAIVSTGLHEPSAIDVARASRATVPETMIILLAGGDDRGSMLDGFRAGVTGFVTSDTSRLDLLATLRRTLAGESVIDPAAATQLIMRMAAESEMAQQAVPDALTPRELEILRLVAQGHTNRQIAERLIVAVGTIKVHVEHILGKLGASDRTQAAVRAVELGIVHGDDSERPRPFSH